jgi:hypothetical protein
MLGDLIIGAVDIITDIVIDAVTGSDDDDEADADETSSEGGDTPG